MLRKVRNRRDSFHFPYAVFCIRAHLYVGVAHIIPLRCRYVSAALSIWGMLVQCGSERSVDLRGAKARLRSTPVGAELPSTGRQLCTLCNPVLCGQHQVSLGWSRDCLCSATIVAKQRFTRTLATFRAYARTDFGVVIFLNCYKYFSDFKFGGRRYLALWRCFIVRSR